MSEDNERFLENTFECCDIDCSGKCYCKDNKKMTFCGNRCDETCGQCLDCELDDNLREMIQGESSKESIDALISMKTLLISFMKDQNSNTVKKLKKEVQALHILRDRQKF